MKYILFVFLFFVSISVSAQDPNSPSAQAWEMLSLNQNTALPTMDKTEVELRGSPFFNDEWTKGTLTTKDGTSYEGTELKYDVFQDGVWFKNERTKQVVVVDPTSLSGFTVIDTVNVERRFQSIQQVSTDSNKSFDPGYYELVFDGDTRVFCKWVKVYVKADYKGAYSSNKKYDEFVNENPKYYILKSDDSWFKVTKSKASVLDALADKEEEVSNFIKKNKIKTRTLEDLLELVKYYDSL